MGAQGAAGAPPLAYQIHGATEVMHPRHATSVWPCDHVASINACHMHHELAGSKLAEIGEGIALVASSVLALYT